MTPQPHQKAAFRRWVRANHPDVGGDPAAFAAGIQAAREGRWSEFESPEGASEGMFEPGSKPDRTTIYIRRSVRGVARVVYVAQRWNARRKSPPRVH